MEELDPLALDRELGRAVPRWRAWRLALAEGNLQASPLEHHRVVCRRATYQALLELPESEPLRAPLSRWVYRLTEQRVNARGLATVRAAEVVEEHAVDVPERVHASLRTLLLRALGDTPRRGAWLQAMLGRAERATAAHAELWERRLEVANRMGHDHPDEIELPDASVYAAARDWLTRTDALAHDALARELPALLGQALGEGAEAGWPARLTLRTVAELLNPAGLLDGLDLGPGRLPQPLAPASFLRALAVVGAAFVDASAPTHQPFAIAHDPYGLRRWTLAALFGLLPTNPEFLRRQLGLDRARIGDPLRALAAAVLIESRASALRVSLRRAALEGSSSYLAAYEESIAESFGVSLDPARAAGVLWRLHVDDAQRFAGLLSAAGLALESTEAHDEDWFRNPRAVDQLRSEAELSPETTVTAEVLDAGARAFAATLTAALG